MKKLTLLLVMLVLVTLGIQGVGAEEVIVEEVLEPTAWDNWMALITDFASLKNAIVSIGGVAGLISLMKLRGIYKFLKSPAGLVVIEKMALKIIGKVTESPELVMNVAKIVATMPVVKDILDKAKAKASIYELELQGKILDMEAKLSAKVFEDGAQAEAMTYLTKLREEYETLTTSE